jgi:hypothetical protein
METIDRFILSKLIFQIERSQKAYQLYLSDKRYFQALRIFNANQQIYHIVASGEISDDSIRDLIVEYVFHLEDWFVQFKYFERSQKPELEDVFVFEPLSDSVRFPKLIIESLKNIQK